MENRRQKVRKSNLVNSVRIARVALALHISFVVVSPLVVLAQGGVDEIARLNIELQRAKEVDDIGKAVEIGRTLVDLQPNEAAPAYNLACVYSRAGDKDQAVHWLLASAERGFSYVATLLRDTDLDDIRNHAGFAQAVELIKQNNAAALERFKPQAEGAKIVTIVPPNFDETKPAPLIVALHGYGGNAQDIASVWRGPAARFGAVLIAPQAIQAADAGFSWGVVEQGEYLVMRAIERARAGHNVDPKRIVLTGFSQGGGMCFTLGLRQPGLFAGVIPVAGVYEDRVDPIPPQSRATLPRFVIMNGADDREAENNRAAAERLKAINVPVLLRIYDNVGHAFPPNREVELDIALRFVLEP